MSEVQTTAAATDGLRSGTRQPRSSMFQNRKSKRRPERMPPPAGHPWTDGPNKTPGSVAKFRNRMPEPTRNVICVASARRYYRINGFGENVALTYTLTIFTPGGRKILTVTDKGLGSVAMDVPRSSANADETPEIALLRQACARKRSGIETLGNLGKHQLVDLVVPGHHRVGPRPSRQP